MKPDGAASSRTTSLSSSKEEGPQLLSRLKEASSHSQVSILPPPISNSEYFPRPPLLCVLQAEFPPVREGFLQCAQEAKKEAGMENPNLSPKSWRRGNLCFSSQSGFQTRSATCLMSSWHAYKPHHGSIWESEEVVTTCRAIQLTKGTGSRAGWNCCCGITHAEDNDAMKEVLSVLET